MTERIPLLSPTGAGVIRVQARRVEEFKANGWREPAVEKPAPRRRKAAEGAGEIPDE